MQPNTFNGAGVNDGWGADEGFSSSSDDNTRRQPPGATTTAGLVTAPSGHASYTPGPALVGPGIAQRSASTAAGTHAVPVGLRTQTPTPGATGNPTAGRGPSQGGVGKGPSRSWLCGKAGMRTLTVLAVITVGALLLLTTFVNPPVVPHDPHTMFPRRHGHGRDGRDARPSPLNRLRPPPVDGNAPLVTASLADKATTTTTAPPPIGDRSPLRPSASRPRSTAATPTDAPVDTTLEETTAPAHTTRGHDIVEMKTDEPTTTNEPTEEGGVQTTTHRHAGRKSTQYADDGASDACLCLDHAITAEATGAKSKAPNLRDPFLAITMANVPREEAPAVAAASPALSILQTMRSVLGMALIVADLEAELSHQGNTTQTTDIADTHSRLVGTGAAGISAAAFTQTMSDTVQVWQSTRTQNSTAAGSDHHHSTRFSNPFLFESLNVSLARIVALSAPEGDASAPSAQSGGLGEGIPLYPHIFDHPAASGGDSERFVSYRTPCDTFHYQQQEYILNLGRTQPPLYLRGRFGTCARPVPDHTKGLLSAEDLLPYASHRDVRAELVPSCLERAALFGTEVEEYWAAAAVAADAVGASRQPASPASAAQPAVNPLLAFPMGVVRAFVLALHQRQHEALAGGTCRCPANAAAQASTPSSSSLPRDGIRVGTSLKGTRALQDVLSNINAQLRLITHSRNINREHPLPPPATTTARRKLLSADLVEEDNTKNSNNVSQDLALAEHRLLRGLVSAVVNGRVHATPTSLWHAVFAAPAAEEGRAIPALIPAPDNAVSVHEAKAPRRPPAHHPSRDYMCLLNEAASTENGLIQALPSDFDDYREERRGDGGVSALAAPAATAETEYYTPPFDEGMLVAFSPLRSAVAAALVGLAAEQSIRASVRNASGAIGADARRERRWSTYRRGEDARPTPHVLSMHTRSSDASQSDTSINHGIADALRGLEDRVADGLLRLSPTELASVIPRDPLSILERANVTLDDVFWYTSVYSGGGVDTAATHMPTVSSLAEINKAAYDKSRTKGAAVDTFHSTERSPEAFDTLLFMAHQLISKKNGKRAPIHRRTKHNDNHEEDSGSSEVPTGRSYAFGTAEAVILPEQRAVSAIHRARIAKLLAAANLTASTVSSALPDFSALLEAAVDSAQDQEEVNNRGIASKLFAKILFKRRSQFASKAHSIVRYFDHTRLAVSGGDAEEELPPTRPRRRNGARKTRASSTRRTEAATAATAKRKLLSLSSGGDEAKTEVVATAGHQRLREPTQPSEDIQTTSGADTSARRDFLRPVAAALLFLAAGHVQMPSADTGLNANRAANFASVTMAALEAAYAGDSRLQSSMASILSSVEGSKPTLRKGRGLSDESIRRWSVGVFETEGSAGTLEGGLATMQRTAAFVSRALFGVRNATAAADQGAFLAEHGTRLPSQQHFRDQLARYQAERASAKGPAAAHSFIAPRDTVPAWAQNAMRSDEAAMDFCTHDIARPLSSAALNPTLLSKRSNQSGNAPLVTPLLQRSQLLVTTHGAPLQCYDGISDLVCGSVRRIGAWEPHLHAMLRTITVRLKHGSRLAATILREREAMLVRLLADRRREQAELPTSQEVTGTAVAEAEDEEEILAGLVAEQLQEEALHHGGGHWHLEPLLPTSRLLGLGDADPTRESATLKHKQTARRAAMTLDIADRILLDLPVRVGGEKRTRADLRAAILKDIAAEWREHPQQRSGDHNATEVSDHHTLTMAGRAEQLRHVILHRALGATVRLLRLRLTAHYKRVAGKSKAASPSDAQLDAFVALKIRSIATASAPGPQDTMDFLQWGAEGLRFSDVDDETDAKLSERFLPQLFAVSTNGGRVPPSRLFFDRFSFLLPSLDAPTTVFSGLGDHMDRGSAFRAEWEALGGPDVAGGAEKGAYYYDDGTRGNDADYGHHIPLHDLPQFQPMARPLPHSIQGLADRLRRLYMATTFVSASMRTLGFLSSLHDLVPDPNAPSKEKKTSEAPSPYLPTAEEFYDARIHSEFLAEDMLGAATYVARRTPLSTHAATDRAQIAKSRETPAPTGSAAAARPPTRLVETPVIPALLMPAPGSTSEKKVDDKKRLLMKTSGSTEARVVDRVRGRLHQFEEDVMFLDIGANVGSFAYDIRLGGVVTPATRTFNGINSAAASVELIAKHRRRSGATGQYGLPVVREGATVPASVQALFNDSSIDALLSDDVVLPNDAEVFAAIRPWVPAARLATTYPTHVRLQQRFFQRSLTHHGDVIDSHGAAVPNMVLLEALPSNIFLLETSHCLNKIRERGLWRRAVAGIVAAFAPRVSFAVQQATVRTAGVRLRIPVAGQDLAIEGVTAATVDFVTGTGSDQQHSKRDASDDYNNASTSGTHRHQWLKGIARKLHADGLVALITVRTTAFLPQGLSVEGEEATQALAAALDVFSTTARDEQHTLLLRYVSVFGPCRHLHSVGSNNHPDGRLKRRRPLLQEHVMAASTFVCAPEQLEPVVIHAALGDADASEAAPAIKTTTTAPAEEATERVENRHPTGRKLLAEVAVEGENSQNVGSAGQENPETEGPVLAAHQQLALEVLMKIAAKNQNLTAVSRPTERRTTRAVSAPHRPTKRVVAQEDAPEPATPTSVEAEAVVAVAAQPAGVAAAGADQWCVLMSDAINLADTVLTCDPAEVAMARRIEGYLRAPQALAGAIRQLRTGKDYPAGMRPVTTVLRQPLPIGHPLAFNVVPPALQIRGRLLPSAFVQLRSLSAVLRSRSLLQRPDPALRHSDEQTTHTNKDKDPATSAGAVSQLVQRQQQRDRAARADAVRAEDRLAQQQREAEAIAERLLLTPHSIPSAFMNRPMVRRFHRLLRLLDRALNATDTPAAAKTTAATVPTAAVVSRRMRLYDLLLVACTQRSLIKMDVEGFEPRILAGSEHTLLSNALIRPPVIVTEAWASDALLEQGERMFNQFNYIGVTIEIDSAFPGKREPHLLLTMADLHSLHKLLGKEMNTIVWVQRHLVHLVPQLLSARRPSSHRRVL